MAGFDVLTPNLNLYAHRFIEASAGTGKTFAIEQLVCRMLLDKKGPQIGEILVVTFTKAAAGELKQRIYTTLEETLYALREQKSKLPYLQNFDNAQRKHAIFRLKAALAVFDEAKIFTIHSFCFHALQENALEAGINLDQREESASSLLLERVVKDYLRIHQIHPRQLHDPQKAISTLVQMVRRRIIIEGGCGFSSLLESYAEEIDKIKKEFHLEPEKVLDALLELAPAFKGFTDRKREVKAEMKERIAQFSKMRTDEIDSLLLLFSPENRTKKEVEFPSFFLELQKRLLPLAEKAHDDFSLLAYLAEEIREEVEKKVEEEEWLFYEDLIQKVAVQLERPAFANALRACYRAVFIDEFQDTDPLQWKIFSTLFATEKWGGALYLVGDPKQAIYRFREADIYTYLKAKESFAQKECASLLCNFRSSAHLVKQLNTIFSGAEKLFPLPRKKQELPFQPVLAHKQERGGITFWRAHTEKEFFPAIADEARRLKEQEAICYSDQAVLVKDRFQADRFFRYCQEVGLPVHLRRTVPLTDTAAYAALQDLISAALSPQDHSAFVRLLGGPLFGWSVEEICEKKENFAITFYSYCQTLKEKGLIPFFQKLMDTLSETLFKRIDAATLYSQLRQLIELVAQKTNSCEEYLPFLERLVLEDPETPWLQCDPHSTEDVVAVLTIHASKGLEFAVVYPIGLILPTPRKKELTFLPERRILTVEEDPLQAEESDAEKMRQLYVAFTRAKNYLYLPTLEEKSYAAGTTPPMDLFLQRVGSSLTFTPLSKTVRPEKKSSYALLAPEPVTVAPPLLFINSFSSLTTHSLEYKETPPINKKDLPGGPETGILLHKLFEELDFKKAFHASSLKPLITPLLYKTPLEPYLDTVSAIVYKALHTPLPAEKPFPLSAVPPDNIFKEMEFLYSTEGGFIKGFIDLLFVYKEKYYLIDWKSNVLPAYEKKNVKEAMEENSYFLQSSLYREAAERYFSRFEKKYYYGGTFYIFLRGLPNGIFIEKLHS